MFVAILIGGTLAVGELIFRWGKKATQRMHVRKEARTYVCT
jgi:hypothetical protein